MIVRTALPGVSTGSTGDQGGGTTTSSFALIAEDPYSTVAAEYTPAPRARSAYQSEAELEADLIDRLVGQGYERLTVTKPAELETNLRQQLGVLNGHEFTDAEWARLFKEFIATNDGVVGKTRRFQTDPRHFFTFDDGSKRNVTLFDKQNLTRNRLQVIHQYEAVGARANRYDVTILVNGLPLVHVELKRRGVRLREAFNQIKRYERDSFWADNALFEYVQLYVISNGTHTRYYSNTTRDTVTTTGSRKKVSQAWEFTSVWADARNHLIEDLEDFAKTFLAGRNLLAVLANFCVVTADDRLMVMRPYQIAATERVLNRILVAANNKRVGTRDAGGYIWHTTGSGKTLTSFKCAQLATAMSEVDRVLFVVDRKDLDAQTVGEYKHFGEVTYGKDITENFYTKSTAQLTKRLGDPSSRIIVTTIQKLSRFIANNPDHPVFQEQVALIFDECHRSQFGNMHKQITQRFKNYFIFGFTGTPIFADNAATVSASQVAAAVRRTGPADRSTLEVTTAQLFGKQLHTYTILDAIRDKTVLRFNVQYYNTLRAKPEVLTGPRGATLVKAIDEPEALMKPERLAGIVEHILEHYNQLTCQTSAYRLGRRDGQGQTATSTVKGFNGLFAVASIEAAMRYYQEFRQQLAATGSGLKVATIFSFAPNDEELPDTCDELDTTQRDFLDGAIVDFNAMFGTSYDTSSDQFPKYYSHVSRAMKNKELDLLIVVNMFLTGFDAKALNTLWVDKNLEYHGLIQAFSRTNRILDSVKAFGNIVCYRDLKEKTDAALALFGSTDAASVVLLPTFDELYFGTDVVNAQGETVHKPGYQDGVEALLADFPLPVSTPGEVDQKHFIRLFGSLLKARNTLAAFDQFEGRELLTDGEWQDYLSHYVDLNDELTRRSAGEKTSVLDDVEFEMELVRQNEITYDYIVELVRDYQSSSTKVEVRIIIERALNSSPTLRPKRDLILAFLDSGSSQDLGDWLADRREEELTALIAEERLRDEPTRTLLDRAFSDGALRTTGGSIDAILPPMSRFFSHGEDRSTKKARVTAALLEFFERYEGTGFGA